MTMTTFSLPYDIDTIKDIICDRYGKLLGEPGDHSPSPYVVPTLNDEKNKFCLHYGHINRDGAMRTNYWRADVTLKKLNDKQTSLHVTFKNNNNLEYTTTYREDGKAGVWNREQMNNRVIEKLIDYLNKNCTQSDKMDHKLADKLQKEQAEKKASSQTHAKR